MVTIRHLRVDKLCLSRTYMTLKEREDYNSALSQARLYSDAGELQRYSGNYQTKFRKKYQSEQKPEVWFRFGGNHKRCWSRIEFTPSKLTNDDWIDFATLCRLIHGDANYGELQPVLEYFTIALIELAVDIRAPIKSYIYVAPGFGDPYHPNYVPKGTFYLGAEKSPTHFIIYDKQKRFVKKGIHIDYPLTRIEARILQTGIKLPDLRNIPRPFGNLLVVPTEKLVHLGNGKAVQSFVHNINLGKIAQEVYRLHSPYQRKQIKIALKKHSLKLAASQARWETWLQQRSNDWCQRFDAIQ